MIDAPLRATEDQPEQLALQSDFWPRFWKWLGLGVVLLISIFMNFYQLGQNGFGNLYYAAGVRSMADSLHNFFFVSLDPGGFVTIDKPPLGFWFQVASVKIFGFTPFAIFFPQALAGVLSVLLLYYLVRRHFGVIAGLLAALALAISPISVVTNRNNTIDSTLVLALLLGAWAVLRAAETGKLRWLLLCAVFVGLGFNIKMLEAYLVVPAFAALYLLAAPGRLRTRLWHLAVAGLLMAALSLSWAAVVDLIPAIQRPYVGSSQNNSEISLALGYNGLQRLTGNNGGGSAGRNFPGAGSGNPGGVLPPGLGIGSPGGTFGGSGGGGTSAVGVFNTGNPGLLRLFTEPLGGQIAWLLPLAMLGLLALAWQRRPRFAERVESETDGPPGRLRLVGRWFSRFRDAREQQSMLLWGIWLLTMGVFYSVAGFFHQYYMSTFAPAIAALFGIGVVVMWRDYRRDGWRGWLLPLALLATAAEQIYLIETDPSWGTWLIPLIAMPSLVAALALFALRLLPAFRLPSVRLNQRLRRRVLAAPSGSGPCGNPVPAVSPALLARGPLSGFPQSRSRWSLAHPRVLVAALCMGLAALLLTPAVWSAIPGLQNITQDLPIAGASQQGVGGGGATINVDTALMSYLEANQGSAKYLVAVSSAQEASSIILATNKPVMALGGFTGSDPILTTGQLAKLVSQGVVRFFLISGGGGGFGGGGGPGGQSSLTSWVTSNCTAVSSSQLQSSSQLYDCSAAT